MTKTYHLAVDLGATSGRTMLATYDGERVEMRELTRFKYPMVPIGGHLFWNLPKIYMEILDSLKKCGEMLDSEGVKLSSAGIDTWGCDMAYFHKDGTIASLPYCYRDSHTEGAVENFALKMPKEKLYAKTGIQFMDINSLFQLYTIKENSPEVIEGADKILFMPDAFIYLLTGKAVMERTIASTSQMLDPFTGDLDAEILETLGINREKFGETVNPGTVIGPLSKQVREYTGLGDVPVIAVAGHDTASAVAAVPSSDENFAYLSCGTWSLFGIETPQPVINAASRACNFTNEGGVDSTTRFLKNISGLWIFEKCREEFKGVPEKIEELVALCEESDCDSIIDPEHPSFDHPSNMKEAISKYCDETGQKQLVKEADFIRVVFKSLARKYGEVLDSIRQFSQSEIKRLHVIGGGSQNPYLMQYTADETGLTVHAGPAECTALGNVLMQLRAIGILSNLSEMRKVSINSTSPKIYTPQNN